MKQGTTMALSERQKISHLLRRLGLGAGEIELQTYLPLGVEGTIDRLINYENVESGITMLPYQMSVDKPDSPPNLDSYIASMWWTFRMWATQRPLEEKLALFWHTHLAVGADKVDFSPMMFEYLGILRRRQMGRFADLLKDVSISGAMLRYLDGDHSIANRSNENFAREVMELFTMGIGNYTEHDVHEAARICTGFGLSYPIFEDNGQKYDLRVRSFLESGIPLAGGFWSYALHDQGNKTILGQSGAFTPNDFMEILCKEPATAKRIGTKFFEFFAYNRPSQAIQEHMGSLFKKHDGNSKKILLDLVQMDEFWSDKAVRGIYKSPVDFCIALFRQTGLGDMIRKKQNPLSEVTPIDPQLKGGLYYLVSLLQKQGLQPLYPPNVKGWIWGHQWVTAGSLSNRIQLSSSLFWMGNPKQRIGNATANLILKQNPKNEQEVVELFLRQFDADPDTVHMKLLVEAFNKVGGMTNLQNIDNAPVPLTELAKLAFSAPEFQFC